MAFRWIVTLIVPFALLCSIASAEESGRIVLREWPADGAVNVDSPHVNQAYLATDELHPRLRLKFATDATGVGAVIRAPAGMTGGSLAMYIEIAAQSGQFPDGRIVFIASDAAGRPTGAAGMRWDYTATRWGMYDVEVTYSHSSGLIPQITIDSAQNTVQGTLGDSGGDFATVRLSKLYVHKDGPHSLTLHQTTLAETAPVTIRAVTLRPRSEGERIAQQPDGVIELHSRDATVQGVRLRYEPKPEKNTLGFWTNVEDWAWWEFDAMRGGEYEVEVLQGCGSGQGGSEVAVTVGDQTLRFTVEDTGHFQNFIERRIGRVKLAAPGRYTLSVKPQTKAVKAVMDLRRIRLIPVK